MQQIFYDLMQEIRDEGRTVFLSSHVLSEVDSICDRVGILRDGVLQAVERVDHLKKVQYRWLTLYTAESVTIADWSRIPGVSNVSLIASGIRMRVTGSLDSVVKQAAQFAVQDMHIEEPSLEEIFLAYYGND